MCLKYFVELFQKMVGLIDIGVTVREMLRVEISNKLSQ